MIDMIKTILKALPLLSGITMLVIFSWIGAEYVIEGAVSFGMVDGAIAVTIAIYILFAIVKAYSQKGKY